MEIVSTKENLKRALSLASRAVGNNTTLPVLNNLLLKVEKGQLKIAATNLEIAIKTWIGVEIEEVGEITVPAKTITEHISNISDEKVRLKTKGNDLLVESEKTNSIVKGLAAEEFPLIPDIKGEKSIETNAKELAGALNQVSFASAFSETQPELSGVMLGIEEKEVKMVATDRYRLAEKTLKLKERGSMKKIIIPNRVVTEVVRILGDTSGGVELLASENQVLFKTQEAEIISRLIEGKYPDYHEIIPKDFSTEVKNTNERVCFSVKTIWPFCSGE